MDPWGVTLFWYIPLHNYKSVCNLQQKTKFFGTCLYMKKMYTIYSKKKRNVHGVFLGTWLTAKWGANLKYVNCRTLFGSIPTISSKLSSANLCRGANIVQDFKFVVIAPHCLQATTSSGVHMVEAPCFTLKSPLCFTHAASPSMGAIWFTSSGSNGGCWVVLVVLFFFLPSVFPFPLPCLILTFCTLIMRGWWGLPFLLPPPTASSSSPSPSSSSSFSSS